MRYANQQNRSSQGSFIFDYKNNRPESRGKGKLGGGIPSGAGVNSGAAARFAIFGRSSGGDNGMNAGLPPSNLRHPRLGNGNGGNNNGDLL